MNRKANKLMTINEPHQARTSLRVNPKELTLRLGVAQIVRFT